MSDVAVIAWPHHRVPVPMFQTDATQRMRHVNRHWLGLLGFEAADVLARPLADFLTPKSLAEHLEHRLGPADEMRDIECGFVAASGVEIEVLLSYLVERDGSGTQCGILGAMVDLTARRAAERTAGLNAALLLSVITHASDAILITEAEPVDAPGPRIRYANPAFCAMTGYSPNEIIALTPRILQGPKTDRAELDRLRQALKRWRPVRVQLVNYTKAGVEFDVEIDLTPVADDTGLFTHWIGIQRNVTTRRKQEAALRHSQKMEAVGQLTGGISHDFNNLLAGISGSLELIGLRLGQKRYGELERYVDGALVSANRAAALTQRLLAFSRRQTLKPQAIDLNHLFTGMAELFRGTVGLGIVIDTTLTEAPWPVLCDPSQLENALLNLVINARDAMPSGGRLSIATANLAIAHADPLHDVPAGEYMALSITDNGTGMAPDTIARAFDPFFTTKPLGQGTGLGLSMIYGFVQQTGGHVRLRSAEGAGTTVAIYLPRHFGEVAAEPLAEPVGRPPPIEHSVVLLVEDEPVVRMIVRDMLGEIGCAVLEAETGHAGLAFANTDTRIDLLLTDLGLPGDMDGQQLAAAARALRPDLKVLFITGYDESVVAGDGKQAPIEVVTKPFAVGALAARVRELIGAD